MSNGFSFNLLVSKL